MGFHRSRYGPTRGEQDSGGLHRLALHGEGRAKSPEQPRSRPIRPAVVLWRGGWLLLVREAVAVQSRARRGLAREGRRSCGVLDHARFAPFANATGALGERS